MLQREGIRVKGETVRLWRLAPVAVLLAAGCSSEPTSPPPPGRYSMRGHVTLIGHLVNGNGGVTGTREVQDADSVVVELLYGTAVVARTKTRGGDYTFTDLAPGGYRVRSWLTPAINDSTLPLTIAQGDIAIGDTLRLVSEGELTPVPNPFVAETFVYFTLPDTERIYVDVLGVAGDTIKPLLHAERFEGQNQVRWDGTDRNGQLSLAPLAWVTFSTPADSGKAPAIRDLRGQLLFHQP
jgi:hypothetical protein